MSFRNEIINGIGSVPPLPTASVEVLRLLRDPDASTTTIAQGIEHDPSLTTNVLRLANSAYFGFPQGVKTIREAVFRLGTNQIFQLVVSATIARMAQRPMHAYDLSGAGLWDHLVGTAIATGRIARAVKLKVPAYTFTAGLTHDVGKIVLGAFFDLSAKSIITHAFDQGASFEEAERVVLGIDHAEVGALLLEHWNLPPELVNVVRWHHQPDNCEGDPLVASLVHVADVTCLMSGVGAALDSLNYRPSGQALSRLGIAMGVLGEIVYEILNDLLEVRKLFAFGDDRSTPDGQSSGSRLPAAGSEQP